METRKTLLFILDRDLQRTAQYAKNLAEAFELHFYEDVDACFHDLLVAIEPVAVVANRMDRGLNLLEKVRSHKFTQHVPVFITAQEASTGLRREVYKLGGTDMYSLHVDFEVLEARVLQALEKTAKKAVIKNLHIASRFKVPLWKRFIDVSTTGLALLLLSPLLVIVAILIKLDSKGPIIYKSLRVGTGYKIFEIYKFRTMRTNADQLIKNMGDLNMYAKGAKKDIVGLCMDCKASGSCSNLLYKDGEQVCEKAYLEAKNNEVAFMKFQNDPRITKLGKFLRNSSIDELPQLFNIFLGDMSLIGNRPLPLYEAEKLTTDKYIERFAGPSGLTGLWQVTKRGKGKKDMTEEERIQLDIEYARNFSFAFDMKIFFKTFPALLQTENV